jgi:hypothetical protein
MRRIADIKQCLSAGLHPRDFGGEEIGDGAQRTAYLVGDYVIKQRAPAWQHDAESEDPTPCPPRRAFDVPRASFVRVGLRPPRQWMVGEWVIQPYYRPFTPNERIEWEYINELTVYWSPTRLKVHRVKLDVHCNNVGVDPRTGTVHCYDW